ncbi:MAG: orotidine-5'-phosphate decarboxylase [Gemmatimonadaceae bacterium]|nr:orotidine-5'-phosphate decarboxylase [Gemmatimonadaceae bacterium]MCW5825491.1 orotidine-5'-phosphate decarboxylase [Gemmatimonadaceae bacterium]
MRAQPIIALDVPTLAAAQALCARLGPQADFVKVGLELFTAEGPRVVEWLRGEGKRVFLDLKLYDIPNTVRGAARSAAQMGVSLLTVHGYGGAAMVDAAVDGAGAETGILVVTVLTSFDASALGVALGREAPELGGEVLRLAQLADAAGAHGIVCSGQEVRAARASYPKLRPLVPGIRLAGGATHDQARIATPEKAAEDGAAYLVLGRAVTEAASPAEVLAGILATLR